MSDQHEGNPEQLGKFPMSLQEFAKAVRELMVKDCKIDACLDKFIFRTYQLPGKKKGFPWIPVENLKEGEKPVDGSLLDQIEDDLLAELDSFIPEFCEEEFPDSATRDHKLDILEARLRKRWKEWLLWEKTAPSGDKELHKKLLEVRGTRDLNVQGVSVKQDKDDSRITSPGVGQLQLDELKSVVKDDQSAALFTCGGSIAITHSQDRCDVLRQSSPVTLYWSSKDGTICKTILPGSNADSNTGSFQTLVEDCTPATFGLGHRDVLDPSYRHAGKLDTGRFGTTFHPADFGILDSVEQTLLPNISSSLENALEFRRVRAELYKLNVYSGPSGLFRAHVDTPRSPNQFGSLVVCLPSPHQGGKLVVRHQGASVEFPWDDGSLSNIQWAAFYSDCEHEIERVTEGHRVTLTYNLFITEPLGASLLPNPLVDPRTLPLYARMKGLLAQADFMDEGGILGIFCSHSYAHTSEEANLLLPRKLKGADMALYATLKSLGLWVRIMPILHANIYERDYSSSCELREYRKQGYVNSTRKETTPRPLKLKYFHLFHSDDYVQDVHKRWQFLYKTRIPHGAGLRVNIVGTALHPMATSEWDYDTPFPEVLGSFWPSICVSDINWINKPGSRKQALSHMVYGNEASTQTEYSSAAILAIIPPWDQRNTETLGN
ncbi:hypothetical protein CIHG_04211 [Coccidioides immitis H538.4]|uniref:Fe2OG dioxygenase domain-containing protein n=1 Tax=Coccidioides immitis H538.4 TaxID=396776 RepID=A0A0J8RNM9_COCIT|nr:hypothetical protein CIHG_04211 [Coccidioides immitis H538.4]